MNDDLIAKLLCRTADLSVGASTLRNQGAKGVVSKARALLKELDLQLYARKSRPAFRRQLDADTERIKTRLPPGAKHWGTARKALNIFLRDARYNAYLNKRYSLSHIDEWLELPLDSYTAKGLLEEDEGTDLPRWTGVKHLDRETSGQYQRVASRVAERMNTFPVHLDVIYWRRTKK